MFASWLRRCETGVGGCLWGAPEGVQEVIAFVLRGHDALSYSPVH